MGQDEFVLNYTDVAGVARSTRITLAQCEFGNTVNSRKYAYSYKVEEDTINV